MPKVSLWAGKIAQGWQMQGLQFDPRFCKTKLKQNKTKVCGGVNWGMMNQGYGI